MIKWWFLKSYINSFILYQLIHMICCIIVVGAFRASGSEACFFNSEAIMSRESILIIGVSKNLLWVITYCLLSCLRTMDGRVCCAWRKGRLRRVSPWAWCREREGGVCSPPRTSRRRCFDVNVINSIVILIIFIRQRGRGYSWGRRGSVCHIHATVRLDIQSVTTVCTTTQRMTFPHAIIVP